MMLKHADAEMADSAAKYNDLKARKDRIESELKKLGALLKEGMAERTGCTKAWFGDYEVSVTEVSGSLTADTEKMKADGIFEKYSKMKAGHVNLSVKYSKAPVIGAPF